ncbi:NADH-quinone oxidoreductase subunit NuoN [Campylobacter sp. FMV-PI01]|uniref:NADH-quinone oxidoreductase subunit N n=1 Tax=Campylobacter portucalensis TaxID=2608384 RepID=A0A6L5WFC2_9BACT|nr:NADH-quinone oxidoreductase subunit NuoN [Campylobacter portucalensis]MSN95710.1 NADH-quinone oxidoreductase subunit NuoN [Campylobacter portucalensis]
MLESKFEFGILNFGLISPVVVLILFGLLMLCVSMVKKDLNNKFYIYISVIALILNLAFLFGTGDGKTRGFFGLVLLDGVAFMGLVIISLMSIFFVLFFDGEEEEFKRPEYYVLYLFMLSGYEFMVISENLILIIVGLEFSSLALYTMIAMRNTNFSVESAIKYFVMGALGTGFFVFGAGILYYATGRIDISGINLFLESSKPNHILFVGVVFMMVAIGFKVSLVPFHTWLGDIYESSHSFLAGFISIIPKFAALVVAFRFFDVMIESGVYFAQILLYILSIITMFVGNLTALIQKDIKRMLAFSSISHVGFLMAGILISTTYANVSLFIYWIMFCIANLGVFGLLWALKQNGDLKYDYPFESFFGLARKDIKSALLMAIFMLSLAGFPPFSLFWGKMYLMGAAINSGFIFLALAMAINSAIGVYYYLRVVVVMFLKDGGKSVAKSDKFGFIITSCAILCIIAPFVFKALIPKIYEMLILSGF